LFLLIGTSSHKIILGRESNTRTLTKNEPQVITDTNIAAIVNGQRITRQELSDLLIDTYGEDALEILIRRALIYQEAEKRGISVSSKEVGQRLKKLVDDEIEVMMRVNQIKDKTDLERELTRIGTSYEEFKQKIAAKMRKQAEIELLAEKTMVNTITITDEELQRAYDLEYGEKIEASQIVYKTRREAEESLRKLRMGADFETLARNESIDRASAARGGKMQPFSPNDRLGREVTNLKAGELSNIIRTEHGFHIIKITNRKAASNKSFKSVKGELEKTIRDQHYRERLGPWLINLIEKASITKNLN
jgi:foldase protein PrsA